MSNTKKTRVVGRSPHLRLIAIRSHLARALQEFGAAGQLLRDYPLPEGTDIDARMAEFNRALDALRTAATELVASVVDTAEQHHG